jgi:hypothetical protein
LPENAFGAGTATKDEDYPKMVIGNFLAWIVRRPC